MTFLLEPFYGEVSRVDAYDFSREEICPGMQTPYLPTRSGFWRGIPRRLGTAIVLSDSYANLWKDFSKHRYYYSENGYHFLSIPDWTEKKDLIQDIGRPPKSIRQRRKTADSKEYSGDAFIHNKDYPRVFPFHCLTDKTVPKVVSYRCYLLTAEQLNTLEEYYDTPDLDKMGSDNGEKRMAIHPCRYTLARRSAVATSANVIDEAYGGAILTLTVAL